MQADALDSREYNTSMEQTEEKLLTPKELCKRWQISYRNLLYMIEQEEIEPIRIGKQLRFSMDSILEYERNSK